MLRVSRLCKQLGGRHVLKDLDCAWEKPGVLVVSGENVHGYRVLRVSSGNVPSTLAAVLLEIRNETGVVPTIYFEWTEGNPILNMMKFLFVGKGEVAPVTREVLREAEKDLKRRPAVHVS